MRPSRLAPLLAALVLLLTAAPASAAGRFPSSFLWGVATSGFQTEMGASTADIDRGSDWWVWTHDPSIRAAGIVSGDRPEDGPGSWRRYRSDDRLARDRLHAGAFRLGIEWSRIFPRSTRSVHIGSRVTRADLRALDRLADHRALAHYRAVLRDVQRRGMVPFVTINHFTLPLWVHDPIATRAAFAGRGPDDPLPAFSRPAGWLDEQTVRDFRGYAAYLAWKLGDLVRFWSPINEPVVVAAQGFVNAPGLPGGFPPGVLSFTAASVALQHLAAANEAAYDEVHRWDRDARVGLVQNMIAFTGSDAHAVHDADQLFNRLFLDAAIKGIVDRNTNGRVDPGERDPRAAGKADFLGVNYYQRGRVQPLSAPVSTRIPLLDFVPQLTWRSLVAPDAPPCPTQCGELGSELYPEGLRSVLRIAGAYGKPIYITENGVGDGTDRLRRTYLPAQLRVLRTAIADGADVRGYFHWSLTDNFEWSAGYAPRFGVFTIDRRPRPSAAYLARVFRTGRP